MKRLKIILPILTVLTVAFIWGNSLMPGDMSSLESNFIFEFLRSLPGGSLITEHFVRKAAHFTEYMLLGILCCADFKAYGKSGFGYVLIALYICLVTAAADESIQLFTADRNGALLDVWLDHAGSITGSAAFQTVYAAVKSRHGNTSAKKST